MDATARAVTTDQVPRCPGSAATASARAVNTVTRSVNPVASTTARRNPRLLGDRLEEGERRVGHGRGQGQTRVAAARAEIQDPLRAPAAEPRERRQAVEDVRGRDG